MLGMIHNAARKMVLENHGPAVWARVLSESGLDADTPQSFQPPDQPCKEHEILALVTSTAKTIAAPLSSCLEQLGLFWVLQISNSNADARLPTYGRNIWDQLANLDQIHALVPTPFPGQNIPSFTLIRSADTRYQLHYRNASRGLSPFVIGLLKGYSVLFETPLGINLSLNRIEDQGQYCIFTLE